MHWQNLSLICSQMMLYLIVEVPMVLTHIWYAQDITTLTEVFWERLFRHHHCAWNYRHFQTSLVRRKTTKDRAWKWMIQEIYIGFDFGQHGIRWATLEKVVARLYISRYHEQWSMKQLLRTVTRRHWMSRCLHDGQIRKWRNTCRPIKQRITGHADVLLVQ